MGKMIDLTSKLGEINDIEHYISLKSSYFRLYNANHTTLEQVFKYHSYMGHCFSKVVVVSEKKKKKKSFTFLNWGKQTWYWEKCGYFRLGMEPKFGPREGQKMPWTSIDSDKPVQPLFKLKTPNGVQQVA